MVSTLLLLAIAGAAILDEFTPGKAAATVAGPALLGFIALQFRALALVARFLLALSAVVLVAAIQVGTFDKTLLASAIDRGAFLAFFVIAVNILRDAAESSELIRKCGEVIVNQPPGRRYLVLTIGGNLFGVFLSIGAVNLLTTMVYRSIYEDGDTRSDPDQARIRRIRLRRMTMAIMRGFCAVPLWAPTSVTIAIVLARFEDMAWVDVLWLGLPGTAVFIFAGWALDRLSYPPASRRTQNVPDQQNRDYSQILRLVLMAAMIPTFGALVANLLDTRLIFGLLLCMPAFSVIWLALQSQADGPGQAVTAVAKRLRDKTLPGLVSLQTEITIFACSGFLAVLLQPQIDIDWLGHIIAQSGMTESTVLIATSWMIAALAMVGLNPILSVSLAAEVLPLVPGLEIAPALMVFMCTMTWAIIVGVAPISTSVRLASLCTKEPPTTVGVFWNGRFSLLMLMGLSLFLLLAG